jgi:hypothetical protein
VACGALPANTGALVVTGTETGSKLGTLSLIGGFSSVGAETGGVIGAETGGVTGVS